MDSIQGSFNQFKTVIHRADDVIQRRPNPNPNPNQYPGNATRNDNDNANFPSSNHKPIRPIMIGLIKHIAIPIE